MLGCVNRSYSGIDNTVILREQSFRLGDLVKYDDEQMEHYCNFESTYQSKQKDYYDWCKQQSGNFGVGLVVELNFETNQITILWAKTRKVQRYIGWTITQLVKV